MKGTGINHIIIIIHICIYIYIKINYHIYKYVYIYGCQYVIMPFNYHFNWAFTTLPFMMWIRCHWDQLLDFGFLAGHGFSATMTTSLKNLRIQKRSREHAISAEPTNQQQVDHQTTSTNQFIIETYLLDVINSHQNRRHSQNDAMCLLIFIVHWHERSMSGAHKMAQVRLKSQALP